MATGRGRTMPSCQDTAAHEDISFAASAMHYHGQCEAKAAGRHHRFQIRMVHKVVPAVTRGGGFGDLPGPGPKSARSISQLRLTRAQCCY
eukprot:scaffold288875_cov19-Tisochrysis_lutea.AAC.1